MWEYNHPIFLSIGTALRTPEWSCCLTWAKWLVVTLKFQWWTRNWRWKRLLEVSMLQKRLYNMKNPEKWSWHRDRKFYTMLPRLSQLKKGINSLLTSTFKRMFSLQTQQIFLPQYMFLYFRISVIFAFAPANCFQPAKNVLDTMRKLDAKHKLGKKTK